MTEERHPIGEFLDANRAVLASLYLFEHPDQNTPITTEQMESWLCEVLDDGMRVHYERAEIMAKGGEQ